MINRGHPLAPTGRLLPAGLLAAGLLVSGCSQMTGDEAPGIAAESFDAARALFDRFVVLGNDYDSGIAELYAEDAEILLIQKKDGGEVRKVSVAGSDFKELVPRILPRAEQAGEQNTYSEVTYTDAGAERVRIDAQRTATPHGFTVPHILVVGPSPAEGEWLIYEEIAVTPL